MIPKTTLARLKRASVEEFYNDFVKPFMEQAIGFEDYRELEDYFLNNNENQQEIRSLKNRIDSRSIPEFIYYIKEQTLKERFLVDLFVKESQFLGLKVVVKDNGIDNMGDFIAGREKQSQRADYAIAFPIKGGQPAAFSLYEIKQNPITSKCTFKEKNLRAYLAEKSNILLFIGTGRFDSRGNGFNYQTAKYTTFGPAIIDKMLKLDIIKYREMGYKPGIQILEKDYDKYFDFRKLTHHEKPGNNRRNV